MGESCCDVCGEPWGIPAPAHECKVVPPIRDTATLLELLEAEERHWMTEMVLNRSHLTAPRYTEAAEACAAITYLIRVYREEASRGT